MRNEATQQRTRSLSDEQRDARADDLATLAREPEFWRFTRAMANLKRASIGEAPQTGVDMREGGGAISTSIPMMDDPLGSGFAHLNEAQCRLTSVTLLLKKLREHHWGSGEELHFVTRRSREAR